MRRLRGAAEHRATRHTQVRETPAEYPGTQAARRVIRCDVTRSEGAYSAECADFAIVTQGRTFDEVLANLREAIGLHLDEREGLTLRVTFEEPLTSRLALAALARRITARNRHGETTWGPATGRESW